MNTITPTAPTVQDIHQAILDNERTIDTLCQFRASLFRLKPKPFDFNDMMAKQFGMIQRLLAQNLLLKSQLINPRLEGNEHLSFIHQA
jgi:hypothetical protein